MFGPLLLLLLALFLPFALVSMLLLRLLQLLTVGYGRLCAILQLD
jgi:hypothetical protein